MADSDADDEVQSDLQHAVLDGDEEAIGAALAAGATVTDECMMDAVRHRTPAVFEQLVAAGGNPAAVVWDNSLVVIALSRGDRDMLRAVVEAREAVSPYLTPLMLAAMNRDDSAEVVHACLQSVAQLDEYADADDPDDMEEMMKAFVCARLPVEDGEADALTFAIAVDNPNCVTALLDAGARVHSDTPACPMSSVRHFQSIEALRSMLAWGHFPRHFMESALVEESVPVLDLLLTWDPSAADIVVDEAGFSTPPLLHMAGVGSAAGVARLLAAGADPGAENSNGNTAVHNACLCCSMDVLRLLLDAGAPVDVVGEDDATPLTLAVGSGWLPAVTALLAAGADPTFPGPGHRSCLHMYGDNDCETPDHVACVDAVSAAGADVNAIDGRGARPLHCAVRNSSVKVVEALVRAGADIEALDADEDEPSPVTPLQIAARLLKPDMVDTLLRLGADPMVTDTPGRTLADDARQLLVNPLLIGGAVTPEELQLQGVPHALLHAWPVHNLLQPAIAWRRRRPAVVLCAMHITPELFASAHAHTGVAEGAGGGAGRKRPRAAPAEHDTAEGEEGGLAAPPPGKRGA
jgi:hypothetical protein